MSPPWKAQKHVPTPPVVTWRERLVPGKSLGLTERLKTGTMVVSVSTKLRTLFPLTATREELWSVTKTIPTKGSLGKGVTWFLIPGYIVSIIMGTPTEELRTSHLESRSLRGNALLDPNRWLSARFLPAYPVQGPAHGWCCPYSG